MLNKRYTPPKFGTDEEIFSLRSMYDTLIDAGIDHESAVEQLERYEWDCHELRAEYEAKQKELENVG